MTENLMISPGLNAYFQAVRKISPNLAERNEKTVFTGIDFARVFIRKIDPGPERARAIHTFVTAMFGKESLKNVSCKKGCSACCHVQPVIQREEATLLAQVVKDKGIELDMELLEEAASFTGTKPEWDAKKKPCVLLGDDGACRVYEDRPQICRNHLVYSNPKDCDIQLHGDIRMVTNEWAEALLTAYRNECEAGNLPKLLLEELNA